MDLNTEDVKIQHHQGAKFADLNISNLNYYKFSANATSYTFNGENVNVILDIHKGISFFMDDSSYR